MRLSCPCLEPWVFCYIFSYWRDRATMWELICDLGLTHDMSKCNWTSAGVAANRFGNVWVPAYTLQVNNIVLSVLLLGFSLKHIKKTKEKHKLFCSVGQPGITTHLTILLLPEVLAGILDCKLVYTSVNTPRFQWSCLIHSFSSHFWWNMILGIIKGLCNMFCQMT